MLVLCNQAWLRQAGWPKEAFAASWSGWPWWNPVYIVLLSRRAPVWVVVSPDSCQISVCRLFGTLAAEKLGKVTGTQDSNISHVSSLILFYNK